MITMDSKNTIIFIIGLLALLQGSSQIDKDENRPYEFSFTIDGEQHRYEKKDVQGIIQGEFGFITGDGIYHVTVYATDENGSFKILSMKNVRISGPLDGSNVGIINVQDKLIIKYTDKPISKPEIQYTSKPIGIYETKYTSKSPYKLETTSFKPQIFTSPSVNRPDSPFYTTTSRSTIFKLTTPSTIRPGCGGCGIIARTTPKTKLLQNPIPFSNNKPPVESAFPRPLSLPVTPPKPNYSNNYIYNNNNKPFVPNTAYSTTETYETTTKPSSHYNYNFENHAKPESENPPVDNSNFGNNFKPQTFETTAKPSQINNYNYNVKPESTKSPIDNGNKYENNNFKQETYITTAKQSLLENNFKPQTSGRTAKSFQFNSNNNYDKPESTKSPIDSGNKYENNNFKQETYITTAKPSVLENNFKPQSFGTTAKPSQFNSNNYYDKPESTKSPIDSGNKYENNNFKQETYTTTAKQSLLENNFKPQTSGRTGKSFQFNSNNNYDKPESTKSPIDSGNKYENNNFKQETYITTAKQSLLGNNNFENKFKPQTFGTTAKLSLFNSNNYYDKSSKATSYNPTSTPEPFTRKIYETSTKRQSGNYNPVQFNPDTPSKSNLPENVNIVYPSPQKPINFISSDIKTENGNIYVPGNKPIPIQDKYPNMKEGLPNGITESDIVGLLYKFNYTVGFHGHYEKGWNNGTKIGGYFVNGRDGYSRIVTYIADENGYRPKYRLVHLGYDSPDTPKADSEKKFGLKNFEFVWYPVN